MSSYAEKAFIEEGCALCIRYDGRDTSSFRPMSIEDRIFPHTDGSSRVRISDSVDILCTVKLESVECMKARPTAGIMEVSVEMSPSCSSVLDVRAMNSLSSIVSEQLQSILTHSGAVDLRSLCIVPHKYCWCLHIDFTILQMDGDPLAHCSLAALVALSCTRVPRTELISADSGLLEDFEVCGDTSVGTALDASRLPISITISKVGETLLIDSSAEEQECASCILSIAVDRFGNCCGITYLKHGLISSEDVFLCVQRAAVAGSAIFEHIDGFHASQRASHASTRAYPDVAPVRYGLLV